MASGTASGATDRAGVQVLDLEAASNSAAIASNRRRGGDVAGFAWPAGGDHCGTTSPHYRRFHWWRLPAGLFRTRWRPSRELRRLGYAGISAASTRLQTCSSGWLCAVSWRCWTGLTAGRANDRASWTLNRRWGFFDAGPARRCGAGTINYGTPVAEIRGLVRHV